MRFLSIAKLFEKVAAVALLMAVPCIAQTEQGSTAARVVAWQPKPGQEAALEEGYKRHLEWHRKNGDTWNWYGWNIISGERDGFFVDGTFFHSWADLDNPVSPAADGTDNAANVYPHGDVKSVAAYDTIPALTHMDRAGLQAPLMTFYSFAVRTGRAAEFEAAMAGTMAKLAPATRCVLFRPVTGTSEYLLLIPSNKASELGQQASTAQTLFANVSRSLKGNVVTSLQIETGRFRRDMSYLPGESPK